MASDIPLGVAPKGNVLIVRVLNLNKVSKARLVLPVGFDKYAKRTEV